MLTLLVSEWFSMYEAQFGYNLLSQKLTLSCKSNASVSFRSRQHFRDMYYTEDKNSYDFLVSQSLNMTLMMSIRLSSIKVKVYSKYKIIKTDKDHFSVLLCWSFI